VLLAIAETIEESIMSTTFMEEFEIVTFDLPWKLKLHKLTSVFLMVKFGIKPLDEATAEQFCSKFQ